MIHLQYLAWPDYGAPESQDFKVIGRILETMREFHQRSLASNSENKIVVHCSAGIGRTGSILSIYNIQLAVEKLWQNKEHLVQSGQY